METRELKFEDVKDKLSNCLGFSLTAEFKYTPIAFREKSEDGSFIIPKIFWPVFVLKSLDGLEAASREDEAGYTTFGDSSKEVQLHLKSGSQRINTLENGILSVDNFYCEDGSILSFSSKNQQEKITDTESKIVCKKCTTRNFIRKLRPELQRELQEAINERNTLSEEELAGLEF